MADEERGELMDVEGEPTDVEDTPDGGAIVTLDNEEEEPGDSDFYRNLVNELDPGDRDKLGTALGALVAADKKAREDRDKQYAEGIKRTGLGNEAPGGADFDGASRVVHPMLTEACVDFAARAIKELFPPAGPAKSLIPGTPTKERDAKARRKVRHLNWQLTVQMPEFRSELEQALTQVPLGGAQYLKLTHDARRKRPVSEFVPIDDLYLPYGATSFYSAVRVTHRQTLSEQEFKRRVATGMYVDPTLLVMALEGASASAGAGAQAEKTEAGAASDKVEGRSQPGDAVEGDRYVLEIYCELDLDHLDESTPRRPEDEELRPYVISIEETTNQVLAVYRNWLETDETAEPMIWIVEFPFVPWRGAYPIGLPQMIGGLSAAATGALRALLDSALVNNLLGGLKLKGGGKGGQNLQPKPTQFTEVEGSMMADDIRKQVMPFPFNPPSIVLYQLLGFLVDAGKGVVQTTFEKLADGHPQQPVGTTLALIEQGMTVFSAIHARLHVAMARVLEVMCRINYMYLDEADVKDEAGEVLANRADYAGPKDVVPVSDPNIFSETQRFAQIQAVVSRSDAHPELYDQRAVERRLLERLKLPDAEALLRKVPEPRPTNAASENLAATMGRPIAAFPEQDHLAHLQVHLEFTQSPMFGMNVLIAPSFLPLILSHLKEHLVLWYFQAMYQLVRKATGVDPEKLLDKDPALGAMLDKVMAAASQQVVPEAASVFAKVPPVIDQARQLLQALAPPQQQDPTVVAAQAAQAETQRRAAADQQKAQTDQARLAAQHEKDRQAAQVRIEELQVEEQRLAQAAQQAQAELEQAQADRQAEARLAELREAAAAARAAADRMTRERMNEEDNLTAIHIATMEIEAGHRSNLSTGTGINPNP